MTDKIRQDFERRFPVPADAVYNNQLDMYCRTSDIRHQHQELWQVWQAAHEEYAGAPKGWTIERLRLADGFIVWCERGGVVVREDGPITDTMFHAFLVDLLDADQQQEQAP